MSLKKIFLNIDGQIKEFEIPVNTQLVTLLKNDGCRGLRQACDGGNCGGCTILLDKKPVLSCLMHAVQAEDKEILTIDGVLNYNDELKLLPECLKLAGSAQCGFCTCGFVMATAGLYFSNREPSSSEITRGLSGNLCRCTGYEKIINGVKLFFDVINNRAELSKDETHDDTAPFGKRLTKIDADGLTKGKALYTSDMNMPNQLVIKLLLSNVAHANIKNIDVTEAEKIQGVKLILTHRNTPKIKYTTAAQGYPEPSPYDVLMFDSKVRFYGEPVAAIIAENDAVAEQALKLIKIEYEELPVMLTFEDSYFNTKAQIHNDNTVKNIENQQKNLVASFEYKQGVIENNSEYISVEGVFETSKQQHCHLEPHCSLAYKDEYSRINIISSTQVPFDVRRIVARTLNLPFSKVRVIKPRIGGGFGGKQEILIETIVAYAAAKLDRPVKLLMTRAEEFSFARTRHPFRTTLKLDFDKSGKLINLVADILSDTGAYGGHASTVAELAAMRIMSLYPSKNISINIKAVYTNKTPAGAFRGYGEPQIMFPLETLMEQAAKKLNMDSSELRAKNHIKKGDYLQVETFFVKPYPKGELINTCELEKMIERGKQVIGWNKKRESNDKDIATGKGMALSMQGSGIANITRSAVTVSLNEDGSIQLLSGAVDVGTGADTVLSQIAGQTLSIPLNKIHIITSDTAVTPYDSGSYASNTTYFAGEATRKACALLRDKIMDWTAEKFNLPRADLIIENFGIRCADFFKPLNELAEQIFADLKAVDTVFSITVKKETAAPPFVAAFADIDVNIKTGKIKVVKFAAMLDCGKIVNPTLAEGQIHGTIMQALGYTLFEEMTYSANGKVKQTDLLAYKIPTIFEKPEFAVEFFETDEPTGPLGLKAVGEVAYAAVAPAINNALFNAAGIHITSLPITPEKVLNQIK